MLLDTFHRPLRNLRLSVTDRCNLRCQYCMPEADYAWLPRTDVLTFEEIDRLVGVFVSLGVDKLRLTGGEPLLRTHLPTLVRSLRAHPVRELAMTTNGILLAPFADELKSAGLGRVTVSLDTLRPERFRQMTRQDEAAQARLHAAAARAPKDPRPFEALSLLAWRRGDRANLRSFSNQALTNQSQDPFLYFLSAESLYQELLRQRAESGTDFEESELDLGRQRCERALELDPWLAPAHHLLAIYTLAANPRAPALAAIHVQRALRCDPQFKPALLTSASLAAAQGNLGQARRILASLLAGPLTDELRQAARQVMADIDRRSPPPARKP